MNTIALQSIVFIYLPAGATMFMTVDDAKMKFSFALAGGGEHYWSSVQMALNNAWFLVVYEVCSDESDHRMKSTIFVGGSKDVVALGKVVKIMQVAIVTPAWMNDTDGWKMDSLEEMWLGSEPKAKGGGTATLCVTATGTRHVISALDTPERKLVGLQRVY